MQQHTYNRHALTQHTSTNIPTVQYSTPCQHQHITTTSTQPQHTTQFNICSSRTHMQHTCIQPTPSQQHISTYLKLPHFLLLNSDIGPFCQYHFWSQSTPQSAYSILPSKLSIVLFYGSFLTLNFMPLSIIIKNFINAGYPVTCAVALLGKQHARVRMSQINLAHLNRAKST